VGPRWQRDNREKKGEAAGGFGRLTGPTQCAGEKREGQRLQLAAGCGLGRKAESQRGEGKEIFYFFFFFSNISNAFSNSF
jgi:hypothetical protein